MRHTPEAIAERRRLNRQPGFTYSHISYACGYTAEEAAEYRKTWGLMPPFWDDVLSDRDEQFERWVNGHPDRVGMRRQACSEAENRTDGGGS